MTKSLGRLIPVLIAVVLLGFACRRTMPDRKIRSLAVYPTDIRGEPKIRILTVEDTDEIKLSVTGAYRLDVIHLDGTTETGGGDKAVSVMVRPTEKGIRIGKDPVARATVSPIGDTKLLVEGKVFPGSLTFYSRVRSLGGAPKPLLQIVVRIGLEQYLVGVLPNEMQAGWPLEALRAQAVASRTYALYHIKTRKNKPYDVKNTVSSQVWKPLEQTLPRVNMAINSTVGVVLLENNALFPAYFHSQCGGRTASGKPVFLHEDLIAFTGVSCPLCGESREPVQKWSLRISKSVAGTRLRKAGLMQGSLASVRALDRARRPLDHMDRAYWMELTTTTGVRQIVNANEFRLAIGGGRDELESTWLTVAESENGTDLIFDGKGFGHGVGMCQYGAKYMAEKQGLDYRDILARYYYGASVVRLWGASPGDPNAPAP